MLLLHGYNHLTYASLVAGHTEVSYLSREGWTLIQTVQLLYPLWISSKLLSEQWYFHELVTLGKRCYLSYFSPFPLFFSVDIQSTMVVVFVSSCTTDPECVYMDMILLLLSEITILRCFLTKKPTRYWDPSEKVQLSMCRNPWCRKSLGIHTTVSLWCDGFYLWYRIYSLSAVRSFACIAALGRKIIRIFSVLFFNYWLILINNPVPLMGLLCNNQGKSVGTTGAERNYQFLRWECFYNLTISCCCHCGCQHSCIGGF